jgi:hypothetical protein
MAIKVVILLQQTSLQEAGVIVTPPLAPQIGYAGRVHLGGWTESVYWGTDDIKALTQALFTGANGALGLLPSRAQLLAFGASVIGVRLYQGGAGKGQSLAASYPGLAIADEDIPQMAILVKCGSTTAAVTRRFTVRAIPDQQVRLGEFQPNQIFTNSVTAFFTALGNFAFRAIDPVASKRVALFSIDLTGLVTLKDNIPIPFLAQDVVTISKAITTTGTFFGGQFVIKQTGPGNTMQLNGWTGGNCTGGVAIKRAYNIYPISPSSCAVTRAVVRKVGRPFEQYRGRRSKRRKTA